jgi:SMC interacting uncharacterized protein involved in chromosome segregation
MGPSSLIPDPLQMWRKAIAELESRGNEFAGRAMNNAEAASALQQMANLSLAMQQTFEKVFSVYLRQLNLPSRREVVELAERLQRIEGKVDQLLPEARRQPNEPRPARTRKPPSRTEEPKAPARRGRTA